MTYGTKENLPPLDSVTSPKTPISSNRRGCSSSLTGLSDLTNRSRGTTNFTSTTPNTNRTVQFQVESRSADEATTISTAEGCPESVASCSDVETTTLVEQRQHQLSPSTPTTLFYLIKNKEWERVIQRCEECPSESSVWIVEDNKNDGSVRWRLLPIHQACEGRPPDHVISALLKANPRSALERDMGGSLPLHLACRERAHKSVTDVLLHHCRKSVTFVDNEGRLPLHYACRQGATTDLVEDLLRRYYRGAMQQDMDGMLPIHWACAQNAPRSVIEALLRAYPDSINVIDKMSRTPLSILLSSSHTEKDAIVVALNRDISYWTTSLQDEVSNLKTLLAHAESQEQSLREELTELQHRFNQVDIQLDQCIHDKEALQEDNTSLLDQCKEINGRNKMLQEMNEKLQEKVQDLGKVLLLMKKEQNTIRGALINMMGNTTKDGVAAAATVVSCVAQDMKNILSSDENQSGEGDLSEDDGRFAEI